ncbi:multiple sugar transport system ATP-binding protein [Geodermatophilus saharensis]|uniref:Multiple sugar transport system ATP-binding protein n=1 Tax=Geodermatophilus saharensis TaxID=1137994 RepID=A0A239HX49_9ACTN|nr:ABC transporter ATP-binding protein [Geodermatophilus saharensis]SNS85960.1 multiple sugar transport system ATP-binding protein [Geodermatophilus saharensis]
MADTGVEGVTVVRGGTTVLRDVTLLAADGELLVVLGPSGSGKSTLLRAVAGLDEVRSGDVLIRGRRVTRVPSAERHVAMVFQSSALLPFLDVAHNLGWGLRVQHRPEAEVQQRVSGRARQLRLGRLLGRRPRELSGGERGLVGIGRALVQVPDVFLLDEPLGDLDAVQRVEVRRQIVDVVRTLGVPTLYVTHDPAEGLVIADRVALLHEGRVVQVGRPRELYERPVDVFVAGFIGDPPIGLLPARLVSAGGQAGFRVGTRTLPLWQPVPPPLLDHVGREVLLGLRPEDVHDAAAGQDPDTVALDGVVSHVEYTGRHQVVAVVVDAPPDGPGGGALGGGSPGGTLHSFYASRAVVRPGDAVRVTVDAARAHVFDPATGRALRHPPDRR